MGLGLHPSSVQIISFSGCRLPLLHCPALFSCKCIYPSSGLSSDTLVHPRFQRVLWIDWGFCCSLLLLFTQMNFFWFPIRACEWVAWAFFFFLSFSPISLDRDGVWLSCRTGKVGGSSSVPAGLEARLPLSLTVHFFLSHCLG